MNRSPRAFVNSIVVCLIVTIGTVGGVGLGVVWMRHQISTTANQIRRLAAEKAEIDRLLTEKTAAIAGSRRPDLLRQANAQFQLGLVPMSDVPVLNESSEAAIRGLVVRSAQDLMERPPVVSVKLARN